MRKKQEGFTLLEVIVATAISTIIVFGAFGILQVSNRQLQIIHTVMSLQEGPREALFKMAQEIHKIVDLGTADAEGIERSDTIDFIVPVPEPDASTLVDANYAPRWASDVQYVLDPNSRQILRISEDLTTSETKQAVLANDDTSLEFSRASATPGLITITIEAQKTLSNGETIPQNPIRMIAQAEARNP